MLQYYSVICRPSDHTVGRPRAEIRPTDFSFLTNTDNNNDHKNLFPGVYCWPPLRRQLFSPNTWMDQLIVVNNHCLLSSE